MSDDSVLWLAVVSIVVILLLSTGCAEFMHISYVVRVVRHSALTQTKKGVVSFMGSPSTANGPG